MMRCFLVMTRWDVFVKRRLKFGNEQVFSDRNKDRTGRNKEFEGIKEWQDEIRNLKKVSLKEGKFLIFPSLTRVSKHQIPKRIPNNTNYISSNQIKPNQIKSNQIKSNQIKSNQMSMESYKWNQMSMESYIPYVNGVVYLNDEAGHSSIRVYDTNVLMCGHSRLRSLALPRNYSVGANACR